MSDESTETSTGTDLAEREEAGPVTTAEGGSPAVPPEASDEQSRVVPEEVRDRLLLPLFLPLLAALVIVLYVANLSRVFLASSDNVAFTIAALVTATILLGAAALSAATRLRSQTLMIILGVAGVTVLGAGMLTFTEAEGEEEAKGGGGYTEPADPAIGTLAVDAQGDLKFQSDEFTVPPGVVEIDYVDVGGGVHTLAFKEAEFAGFELAVPDGKNKGKVDLDTGDYVIYCTIPGHEAAGMWADLISAESGTFGPDWTPAEDGGSGETTTTAATG